MALRQDVVRLIVSAALPFGIVGCAQSAQESQGLTPNPLPKPAQQVTVDFEKGEKGTLPANFTAVSIGGAPVSWVIVEDSTAPAGTKVLAQTSADKTGNRYPVCVYDDLTARDVDASVQFKPVSGTVDQAAGIVWRFRDKDHYYIVRANALESNVVLYKVEKGVRTDLKLKRKTSGYGMKSAVPNGKWSTLRVTAVGDTFEVFINGKKLYEVQDTTFVEAGKVGVWTKADSVTYFDNFKVASLDRDHK